MTVKTSDLIDLGDLSAPKGTLPWVRGVFEEAKTAINGATSQIRDVKLWLKPLRDEGEFRMLSDTRGRVFLSWDIFCSTPQPFGLGHPADVVDAILDEIDEEMKVSIKLGKHGGDRKSPEARDQSTSGTLIPERGQTLPYLKARLERSHPEIFERLEAGGFPSVRKAALEAGIVEPSFQCPNDPLKASRRLLRHFNGDNLVSLLSELANHAGYDLVPKE